MFTGCIIQARMTSSRLPGKVLKPIDWHTGRTILEEVILRVQACPDIDCIVVATTVNTDDDPIEELAGTLDVSCYRGSELDVLDRYYQAAIANGLDRIIRITSDCPFTDPTVLSGVVSLFDTGNYDYVSNAIERTFPHGLDCEMFSFGAIATAHDETKFCDRDRFYREHVTTFIYGHPDRFRLGNYRMPDGKDRHDIRVTVDTREDYLLACVVRSHLRDGYGYQDVMRLFDEMPFLAQINESSVQKRQFVSTADELQAAVSLLRLQEMPRAASILETHLEEVG